MDAYNFWSDLFDTWQSTADWVKALWIVAPTVSAIGALALVLRYRLARRRAGAAQMGTLAYTICRDATGRLHVIRHDPACPRELILLSDSEAPSEAATRPYSHNSSSLG